jgi:hypothetical protein
MTSVARRSFLSALGIGMGGAAAFYGGAGAAAAATPTPTATGLPAYAPASPAYSYDPGANVYNWKPSNTMRHRAALARAMAGGSACEVFIGDSLTAGCVNITGAVYDRLHAIPVVYRDTLASLGVPANGTGIVRVADYVTSDSRMSWKGSWVNYATDMYVQSAGATFTFTTDKSGTDVAVIYLRTSTGGGFTVSVDGASSGPGFVSVPGGGTGWARAQLTGLTNLQPGSRITVTTTSGQLVVLAGFEVSTPSGGLSVHNVAQSGSGASLPARRGWTSTLDANQNYVIWVQSAAQVYAEQPSTVHLLLGVNDVVSGVADAAITAALTTLRNAFPGSDCFLHLPPRPGAVSEERWAAFGTAMWELADALDVPLFDLQDRTGGYTVLAANGLTGDSSAHLNRAGYADWGRAAALVAAR